jgi:hypothetical protein
VLNLRPAGAEWGVLRHFEHGIEEEQMDAVAFHRSGWLSPEQSERAAPNNAGQSENLHNLDS